MSLNNNTKLRIKYETIQSLVPYAKNARTHSDEQIAQIARSIQKFGFTNPVLRDGKHGVIAGHGRLLAAAQLGIAEVPVIELAGMTEAMKRAYIIADNKLALNAGWDTSILKLELAAISELGEDLTITGFSEDEIARLMGDKLGLTDPDDVPENVEPVSKLGDLWQLGNHRLICGDSTDALVVDRVLGGVKPHLMVTDPPYGVKLDPAWRDRAGINSMGKSGAGGENYMDSGKSDVEARWDGVWALSPCEVFYVWCAGSTMVELHHALTDAGFEVRQQLIWNKQMLTRTRSNYWWSHEHCMYGVRKGMTSSWVGKPGQSTVWDIPSPKHIMSGSKEKNEPHPAQKPVECMKRPMVNNSSVGQAVYDPFMGSGTSIIAGEMTGRHVYGIELNPQYVDVTVKRWENFTGLKAKLDGSTEESSRPEVRQAVARGDHAGSQPSRKRRKDKAPRHSGVEAD